MSKFKVGDKVRVVDVISFINVELYSEKLKDVYINKCGVVSDVLEDHPYPYTVNISSNLGYFSMTRNKKLETVANVAKKPTNCFDHADNCCLDWCSRCQECQANKDDLYNALNALEEE